MNDMDIRGKDSGKAYRIELEKAEREAKDYIRGIWTLGDNYESPAAFKKRMKIRGDSNCRVPACIHGDVVHEL
jgi:hypothetical protein